MAQVAGTVAGTTPTTASSTSRCVIEMNGNDGHNYLIKIRLSQVTKCHLRLAFGIPSNIDFYLRDTNNNVEFPVPASEYGVFPTTADAVYYVTFPLTLQRFSVSSNPRAGDNSVQIQPGCVDEDIEVDWNTTKLLDLRGGEGGKTGSKTYTAPNGTVIQASSPVYNNSNYYYIEYLFNGVLKSPNVHSNYYMGTGGDDHTLVFTFPDLWNISHLIACATCYMHNSTSDRVCNYTIEGYGRSNQWTEICGLVETKDDKLGDTRCHMVRKTVSKIRFRVLKLKEARIKYSPCLKEIDIYVAE